MLRQDTGRAGSEPVRNVGFGHNKRSAGYSHHAFIWAATGRWGQIGSGVRDIDSNYSKVSAFELPNIRTTIAGSLLKNWKKEILTRK